MLVSRPSSMVRLSVKCKVRPVRVSGVMDRLVLDAHCRTVNTRSTR